MVMIVLPRRAYTDHLTRSDLVTSHLAAPDPEGRKAPLTGKNLINESRRVTGQDLSPAWHLSPNSSRNRVGLARTTQDLLPECMESMRRGEATEEHLTAVMRASIVLEPADQTRLDTDLSPCLGSMTVRRTKAEAFKRACELDAATMTERAARAEKDAHVSVRPAADCMTRLSALLPLKDGVAIDVALTRHAQKAKATGDPRSLGQIKAALLVAWVRDGAARADHATWADDNAPVEGTDVNGTCQHGPHVEVNVTITDITLLGYTDTPAHIDGFGAVPAGVARQIIRDATDQERATLRKLWTSPKDGTLTQMESKSRIFPKALARYIRTRDQTCTTEYCDAPIRQIDHIHPYAAGGPTSATNGQGLCTACNQAKEHTNIRPGPPVQLPHETAESLKPSNSLANPATAPPDAQPRTG
jgi:5-methylcytosine-specific restriction endonuclease McrA